MSTESKPDNGGPAAASRQLLTTRNEYREAVDMLIGAACHDLRIFDADAADLAFNDPARIGQLAGLLRRSRSNRLYIVVHSPGHLSGQCPRLIELLRHNSDRISIYRTGGDAERAEDCFVLADDLHIVRRRVQAQPRGVLIRNDPREAAMMRERFDQIQESSVSAISATTLGL